MFFFSSRRRHTRCSRDWSSDVCSSDLVAVAAGDGQPADYRARLHEAPPECLRLVEEGQGLATRDGEPRLVALEAQDLVRIDLESDVGQNTGRVGGRRHVLRLRTTSAIRRMCSGLEPQQAPTMLHPASSSAGYSRAIAAGPSS